MLSQQENELLTRTGPGTPAGNLLRRYWQPVALTEELPVNGAPLPLRIMSEDLVLFRDDHGEFGLLGLHCSHRRADLSYGRVENGGLRCLYHGWLFDRHGNCLEQPCERPGKRFCEKVHHLAYPCQERSGIIFTYMGPGEPPLFPAYEPFLAPRDHVLVTKIFHECNYFQANEGNLDPSHVSYLHRQANVPENLKRPVEGSGGKLPLALYEADMAPEIDAEETDYGVRIFQRATSMVVAHSFA
jgi:phthalate 4,5-dioxygenase oxygenase subunit